MIDVWFRWARDVLGIPRIDGRACVFHGTVTVTSIRLRLKPSSFGLRDRIWA